MSKEYLYYFLITLTLILVIALFCVPALNILIFAFGALVSLIFGLRHNPF